ncbi:hypothetical protein E4633_06535 [Geomonas terrae]|uniref:Uncharacterized protein n=1 Tax=Geomonas terrae TaxID=2562681 RepID=A0A4S1CMP8_9BACT|nr:hypothetical protein [Geomonas terrae]TGU75105.1 hypothetical protein E4633_06535 [Geomonas terrae]
MRAEDVARIAYDVDNATQTQVPRGSAGDIQVVVIHNDAEYAAAKALDASSHSRSYMLLLLDFKQD